MRTPSALLLLVCSIELALPGSKESSPGRRAQDPPPAQPPSIVVILTDDQGWGDIRAYGHPTLETPHIDRMAQEGLRLTSFYASASVCTPSRAGFLTGRYAIRTGLTAAIGPGAGVGLPASEITIAEALKTRGYRTALVGKWHLGDGPEFNPTLHGFDEFFGLPYSHDYMPPFVPDTPPVPLLRGTSIIERPVVQSTLTARYTAEAVRFIRDAGDRPFFLYRAHNMPHLPLTGAERFRGRSRGGLYGDVIQELDWSVGEILTTLKETGRDRNTIAVFMSDNGPWIGAPARMMQNGVRPWDVGSAGPFRDSKASTYEGGFRVPGILRWPAGIAPGRVSADVVSNLDLFPTVLHLAGAAVPSDRPIDGKDLRPLLSGKPMEPVPPFFYFAGRSLHAVRDGKWKLRIAGPKAPTELYDLETDPSERHNVAAERAGEVERLRAIMEEFLATLPR